MHDKVTEKDIARMEEYTIVTTVRANSRNRWISPESPLGKAVVGHKKKS